MREGLAVNGVSCLWLCYQRFYLFRVSSEWLKATSRTGDWKRVNQNYKENKTETNKTERHIGTERPSGSGSVLWQQRKGRKYLDGFFSGSDRAMEYVIYGANIGVRNSVMLVMWIQSTNAVAATASSRRKNEQQICAHGYKMVSTISCNTDFNSLDSSKSSRTVYLQLYCSFFLSFFIIILATLIVIEELTI